MALFPVTCWDKDAVGAVQVKRRESQQRRSGNQGMIHGMHEHTGSGLKLLQGELQAGQGPFFRSPVDQHNGLRDFRTQVRGQFLGNDEVRCKAAIEMLIQNPLPGLLSG